MPSTLRRRHYLLREETPCHGEHLANVFSVRLAKVLVKRLYDTMKQYARQYARLYELSLVPSTSFDFKQWAEPCPLCGKQAQTPATAKQAHSRLVRPCESHRHPTAAQRTHLSDLQ